MKEIREAVDKLKIYDPKECRDEIGILLDLAEKVLAVEGKMPERSNKPAFYCPTEILSHAEYKGRKEAIEQCTLAITGALLSESESITQSRPLKCEIEDVAQGRQDRIDMVGFEGTYDALNKLTRRKA